MRIHHLSRGAKLALILVLAIAVMLPLVALLPSYIAWNETRLTQRSLNQSYTASVSNNLGQ